MYTSTLTHIRVVIFSIHKKSTRIRVCITKYKYSYNCMYQKVSMIV